MTDKELAKLEKMSTKELKTKEKTSMLERWELTYREGYNTQLLHFPQCASCIHWLPDPSVWRCVAYPERIPEQIILGQHDHSLPFPGDNGVMFQQMEPEAESRKFGAHLESVKEHSRKLGAEQAERDAAQQT